MNLGATILVLCLLAVNGLSFSLTKASKKSTKTTRSVAVLTNNVQKQESNTSSNKCQYGYQGPHCDECGMTYKTPNLKIVGGVEAVPHSWPAQVLVVFTYKTRVLIEDLGVSLQLSRRYLCGGSLITRDTVMTAAHCVIKTIDFDYNDNYYEINVTTNQNYPTMESMYDIYLGIHNLTGLFTANPPTQPQKVRALIPHPDHSGDSETGINDIALIKLAHEVTLNENVQLACLPPSANYPSDMSKEAYAMGWGTLSADGPLPSKLYNVKFNLYDGSKCDSVLPEAKKDWNSQICAGELAGGKDTCQGDSGGSIFVKDEVNGKPKYVSIGIVSYGDSCALPNKPGIYTKVGAYLDWIESHL